MGVWSATLLQPDGLSAGEGGFKRRYWEERVDAGQVETTDIFHLSPLEGISSSP